ncbi:hypothetical protein R6Q57_002122 [Mikania cordata]
MEEMVGIDLLMATRVEFRLTASLSWLGMPDWDGIRAGINEDCARRNRDRKNELKRHFDNYGGYDNVENAKNHPPDTQTQEAWEKLLMNYSPTLTL